MPYIPKEKRGGAKEPEPLDVNLLNRQARARLYKSALKETKGNVPRAEYIADSRMKRLGLPTSQEMQDSSDLDSVDMNAAERVITRIERNARSTAVGGIGLVTGKEPEPGSYQGVLEKTADEARDRSTGIAEGIPSYLIGYGADPVALGTFGVLGRGAQAARLLGPGSRIGARVADDVGLAALSEGTAAVIRNDPNEDPKTTALLAGVTGGVFRAAGEGVSRQVGKGPLPRSADPPDLDPNFALQREMDARRVPPLADISRRNVSPAERATPRYNPSQLDAPDQQLRIEATSPDPAPAQTQADTPPPADEAIGLAAGIAPPFKPKADPLNPGPALLTPRNFKKATPKERASAILSGFGKGVDYLSLPVIDRVRKISPRMYGRLYKYATESNLRTHKMRSELDPTMHLLREKLPKDVRNRLTSALINGNKNAVDQIAVEMGGESGAAIKKLWRDSRNVLDALFVDAKKAGLDVNYLEDFWPRLIRNSEVGKLRERLHGEWQTEYDDALREVANRKYGGSVESIPHDEMVSILDRVTAGYGPRAADSASPRPLKRRRVNTVSDEMLRHYEPFDVAMDSYIERVSNEIAKRRFLGGDKTATRANADNLKDSFGDILIRENIKGDDADQLQGIVQSLFTHGETPVGPVTDALRTAGYVGTMGQITSTITQLGDFLTVADQRGVANMLKGVYRTSLRKNEVKLLDLGLDRIVEEFQNGIKNQKVIDTVFTLTGLRHMDRFIKNAAIESALVEARTAVTRQGTRRFKDFKKSLVDAYGADEANALIRDIQRKKMTERVLVHLTAKLGDIQPVTKLEVPQGYLDARGAMGGKANGAFRGLPVLGYQLKTFSLRRLGIIRRDALGEMAEGMKMIAGPRGGRKQGIARFLKGSRRLLAMVALFAGGEAGVDQIKGWLTGKDESYWDDLADNVTGLMLLNRYSMEQFERGGGSGFQTLLQPPAYSMLGDFIYDAINIMDEDKAIKTKRRLPHYRTLEMFTGEGERKKRKKRPAR